MIKKNIVFIGYPLDVEFNSEYENRIALCKNDYDKLNCYNEIIDFRNILSKLFSKGKDNLLESELCNRIMSLIDNNTIAIVDTAYAGHSLFEDYDELYNRLNIHLERINNRDIKFFLCEPLNFMGKRRYNSVNMEYKKLIKIMNNKVFLFKDKKNITVGDLKKHEIAFMEYILDNAKL